MSTADVERNAPDRLLKPAEAAAILGVTTRQVEDMARRRELPHVKVGRHVRFRRVRIDEWIEDNER